MGAYQIINSQIFTHLREVDGKSLDTAELLASFSVTMNSEMPHNDLDAVVDQAFG